MNVHRENVTPYMFAIAQYVVYLHHRQGIVI